MLTQKLNTFSQRLSLVPIWHFILALSSGGLIIWSAIQLFQHGCPALPANQNLLLKCSQLPWDLLPIFIGIVFWIIGLACCYYKWETIVLLFLFVSCDTLVTGFVSGLGTDTGIRLFYIFLGLLAPLLYQFHESWLEVQPNRIERILYNLILALSLISVIPFVLWTDQALEIYTISQPLKILIRLLILFSAASTIIMVVRAYRKGTTVVSRSRVRLILSGIVFAIAPLVFLNILPRLVSSHFIPAEFNFPWLLIIPLSYGYSLLRSKLVNSESIIFHVILYFLLAILLLSVSLLLSGLVNWYRGWDGAWLFWGLLLTAVGLLIYSPIRQGLRWLMMWVLYGEQYQYVTMLDHITQALTQIMGRHSLGELLIHRLMQSIPITGGALLLVGSNNCLSVQSVMGLIVPAFLYSSQVDHSNSLKRFDFFVEENLPIAQKDLLKSNWFHGLEKVEQNQILGSGIALWIPLVFNKRLFGLLLLGPKIYEDFFNLEERRMIGILAHQAGITAYNIFLIEDISEGQKELAKANKQLLTAQDKERSRLALDLHDVVIQQLLGLSYQALETRKKMNHQFLTQEVELEIQNDLKSFQESLLGLTSRLRSIIRDLRPVGLEDLGLPEAIEEDLTRLQQAIESGVPKIEWNLEKTGEPISYSIKINLFRITHEAVKNAIVHARAKSVKVNLCFLDDAGILEIIDDGIGFNVPERLSQFAKDNHFGLLNIYERVSSINGRLALVSQAEHGTRVSIHFNFKELLGGNDDDPRGFSR